MKSFGFFDGKLMCLIEASSKSFQIKKGHGGKLKIKIPTQNTVRGRVKFCLFCEIIFLK